MKILLTATVTPRVAGPLFLTDPAVRRDQYVESLRRWVPLAAQQDATLVLVENSGEDLRRLVEDAVGDVPGHVRLVPVDVPEPDVVSRGKGASEAVMLDVACERFFDDPAELWWKCTGRLFISNFAACVPDRLPARPIVARLALDLGWLDTRFFGTTAEIWRAHFTDAIHDVSEPDDLPIEKVFARRALGAVGAGADLVRFPTQPAFTGRSGTHEKRVYDSPVRRLKRLASNQLETILRGPLKGKIY